MSRITDDRIEELFIQYGYDVDDLGYRIETSRAVTLVRAIEAEVDERHAQRLDVMQKMLDEMEERQKLLRKVDVLLNKRKRKRS